MRLVEGDHELLYRAVLLIADDWVHLLPMGAVRILARTSPAPVILASPVALVALQKVPSPDDTAIGLTCKEWKGSALYVPHCMQDTVVIMPRKKQCVYCFMVSSVLAFVTWLFTGATTI